MTSMMMGLLSKLRSVVSGGSFVANTAVFDGTNDWLTASSFVGVSDGKTFTFSFCINLVDGTGEKDLFTIQSGAGSIKFYLYLFNGVVGIDGRRADNATICAMDGSTDLRGAGWKQVYVCADLTDSTKCKMYVNQVPESVTKTITNDTLNLAPASIIATVGSILDGSSKINGALAEFVFKNAYLDDPSAFATGSVPKDIGADGSIPFGAAPVVYLSRNGSGDAWAVDSSSNGNSFTVHGTLGSTTPP